MKSIAAPILCICLALPAWAQDVILARNQWTTVTKADFEQEIARIPKDQQFQYLASAERVARTVEGILVTKTLAAQAREAGIHEEAAVKAEIATATERILARHRTERAEAAIVVPDLAKRAEELYKSDSRKYTEKDIVHAMHILIDARCRSVDAAKARALEARAELSAGKSFADVARKYSDDPSAAKNGGDLGPILIDNLAPAFVEAAMTLKPGGLSEPVLTNFGYHVIRLESVKKGRQYAFAEVRESIIAEVRDDWMKQQRKEFIQRITADPKLKLELDAIQALKTNVNAPVPQPKRPG
jgi:parvulin-like peptidyl-prolyl isomerase